MKKLLIFVVVMVAGYFVYDNFLKEKDAVEINASYNKTREAVNIDAPSIQPRDFASYTGTIKNITDETLINIVVTYLIDAQPSTANIDRLEPGEEKNFTTTTVMLRHMDPGHYLKEVTYDGK
ncbi:MAG: hypothetical protein IPJ23_13540 [Ignavibacteriales bacterium]|nr:hypothetical protein [Ignavibacteriales bacterium]